MTFLSSLGTAPVATAAILARAYIVVAGFRAMSQPRVPIAIRRSVGRYALICFGIMMLAAVVAFAQCSSRGSAPNRGEAEQRYQVSL